ncbi:aspartyl-phosphate phosphatase Spo0E family protein [Alteribacter keqinensis]|uniref:Aspartyl-phosphate phosphatase Spo0E family protein n=1 Tax=Alteribacter keqinensis TaxID=2483800 RepID=A0A3M7TPN1_9BACI|nr:aspartyl-phosphate phosphatase Spo0E family protein [Alteribacter keqinensis]RNA66246.1 aspartyl-phosphate phosphatase Spo0E family protein [Alteribacter keqinensis]
MELEQKDLLEEIEWAREKMYTLSSQLNRTSHEVVEISSYLDQLLNKYQSTYYKIEN